MREITSTLFVLLFLFLTVSFVNAQTRGENFEKKYGKPIVEDKDTQSFHIRKDIILKVVYDDKNSVVRFLVFHSDSEKRIEANLADKLKEEIVPVEKREGKSLTLSFNSSCNGIYWQTYRNVKIKTNHSCDGVNEIEIEFGKFPNEPIKINIQE